MAKSRLSMRREVEAADAGGKKTPKRKKKSTVKKKATRKKATSRARRTKDVAPRRRLVWVVYSSTMREEGRYLYHERDKADGKLEQLMARGKRRYFIQPIKEPLDSEGNPIAEETAVSPKSAPKKSVKKSSPTLDGDAEDTGEAEEDE
ncbi:MAG: hypothetical protein MK102_07140 [Fuerstiella sp.]|nr:hypothetical protein [Fuerstiella sp.]